MNYFKKENTIKICSCLHFSYKRMNLLQNQSQILRHTYFQLNSKLLLRELTLFSVLSFLMNLQWMIYIMCITKIKNSLRRVFLKKSLGMGLRDMKLLIMFSTKSRRRKEWPTCQQSKQQLQRLRRTFSHRAWKSWAQLMTDLKNIWIRRIPLWKYQ